MSVTLENSYFTVDTKGGVTLVFNGSNGSKVKLSDGSILLFAESAAIDTVGNYIEFSYQGNNNGNYDISSINYTGHGKLKDGNIIADSGYSPFATIDFTYEKVRALSSYIAGRSIVRDIRLTSISTHVAGRGGPSLGVFDRRDPAAKAGG